MNSKNIKFIQFVHSGRTWFYSHWHILFSITITGNFCGFYRSGSDRFCPTLQRAISHSLSKNKLAFRSLLNITFPSRQSRFIENKQDRTDEPTDIAIAEPNRETVDPPLAYSACTAVNRFIGGELTSCDDFFMISGIHFFLLGFPFSSFRKPGK
jgi:hypothetical protein